MHVYHVLLLVNGTRPRHHRKRPRLLRQHTRLCQGLADFGDGATTASRRAAGDGGGGAASCRGGCHSTHRLGVISNGQTATTTRMEWSQIFFLSLLSLILLVAAMPSYLSASVLWFMDDGPSRRAMVPLTGRANHHRCKNSVCLRDHFFASFQFRLRVCRRRDS